MTFARVVASGSLSAAARDLDLSLAVVSKRLRQLETRLGVRLLQRTTRRQRLTEEGALFYAQVQRILAEVNEAESLMSRRRLTVSGVLRVTAPGDFGRRRIAPLMADFLRLHPQLTAQLELTDAVVDLVDSGFDLAVRFGSLADSALVARRLAPNFRVLCAAASYLRTRGVPRHPSELAMHRCIVIGSRPRAEWRFEGGGKPLTVTIAASLMTNDGGAAHVWALNGAGIALKSIWDVGDDIASGRLQRVLAPYSMAAAPLHGIYAHGKHLSPRIGAFIDYLREHLGNEWRCKLRSKIES